MSGNSVASRKSNKSYLGDNRKTGGYTGDEELKEFTFTIGVANATRRRAWSHGIEMEKDRRSNDSGNSTC